MFLSDLELQRLTGLSRKSAQARWLLEHGFPHEINRLGQPVVLISAVEQRLGVKVQQKAEPNFSALQSPCISAGIKDDNVRGS